MQRYSLVIGIIGVLAGVALLIMTSLNPKTTTRNPVPLPAEVLDFNTGKSHELPGTEAMLYENAKLGLRFGFPKSFGTVQVEHYGARLFLTFLPKTAMNSGDNSRQVFMDLSREKPEGRNAYWGDLGWYYDAGPNWQNISDVCSFAKKPSSELPTNLKVLISSAPCESIATSDKNAVAKLSVSSSSANVYLLPHTGTLFDNIIVSDERLADDVNFENASTNIEKLVKSLEFIEPTE
ncbi:MAG: hypothetical protein WC802_03040 [Patescibacteria group bacterium]|jgi:hypothetical protein